MQTARHGNTSEATLTGVNGNIVFPESAKTSVRPAEYFDFSSNHGYGEGLSVCGGPRSHSADTRPDCARRHTAWE
jgi:hypothetical protein